MQGQRQPPEAPGTAEPTAADRSARHPSRTMLASCASSWTDRRDKPTARTAPDTLRTARAERTAGRADCLKDGRAREAATRPEVGKRFASPPFPPLDSGPKAPHGPIQANRSGAGPLEVITSRFQRDRPHATNAAFFVNAASVAEGRRAASDPRSTRGEDSPFRYKRDILSHPSHCCPIAAKPAQTRV
jgi:hypothetical protein